MTIAVLLHASSLYKRPGTGLRDGCLKHGSGARFRSPDPRQRSIADDLIKTSTRKSLADTGPRHKSEQFAFGCSGELRIAAAPHLQHNYGRLAVARIRALAQPAISNSCCPRQTRHIRPSSRALCAQRRWARRARRGRCASTSARCIQYTHRRGQPRQRSADRRICSIPIQHVISQCNCTALRDTSAANPPSQLGFHLHLITSAPRCPRRSARPAPWRYTSARRIARRLVSLCTVHRCRHITEPGGHAPNSLRR